MKKAGDLITQSTFKVNQRRSSQKQRRLKGNPKEVWSEEIGIPPKEIGIGPNKTENNFYP